jgi:hypothetical protein
MFTKLKRNLKARLASLFAALRAQGWEPGQAAGWAGKELERQYARLLASDTTWGNLPFACASVELLYQHKPDTVRGNMYLLTSCGWLPDTADKSYNRTQRLLNRLRLNGTVPFAWVVDNLRSTIKPASWPDLPAYVKTVADCYRRDYWAYLPARVEVIVEKDTLAGKLAPVTRELDVPLHPLRGNSSTTFAHDIAQGWQGIDKPVTIYYVGDFDPAGIEIEDDIRTKTLNLAGRVVTWERLAVRPEHFREFKIQPLRPKRKPDGSWADTRTAKFIEKYGEDCAEAEAIPATALRQLVREAILSHIPSGAWERLRRIERQERKQWDAFMEGIKRGQ